MHPTPRTLTLITLSTAATLLPACTSTQRSTAEHAQATAEEPCPLRARLDEQGSLTSAQLVPLLHSPEGREQLARFADEYDTVYYDGQDRYAQVVKTASFYTGTEMPVLAFYFAWQHPDDTVPRDIKFYDNIFGDEFDLVFSPNSIRVTVTSQDDSHPPREYTIPWLPDKKAPWGHIMTRSDRIVLND